MQLTRTNAVFSRIALVSCFCAESQSFRKIPEILFFQKTHGARRRSEEGAQGHHTHPGRGWALAAPRGGVAPPVWPPALPFGLLKASDLKISGGSTLFPETFQSSAAIENPISGIRNSVLAPCRDGELEEIIDTSQTYL